MGEGGSFNGPVWSVSQEIFIYLVFFLVMRWIFRLRAILPLGLAAIFAGLALVKAPLDFWYCGYYFFLGVAVKAAADGFGRPGQAALGLGLCAGYAVLELFGGALPYHVRLPFLFCGLLFFALAAETWAELLFFKRLRFLGDLTYGTYLWHIPFQIAVLTGIQKLGIAASAADSPLFFIAYLLCVFGLARLTFDFIEKPARDWLRQRPAH